MRIIHLSDSFSVDNHKSIGVYQKFEKKKFGNLSQNNYGNHSHKSKKMAYNFSTHKLTKFNHYVLFEGLQLAVLSKSWILPTPFFLLCYCSEVIKLMTREIFERNTMK